MKLYLALILLCTALPGFATEHIKEARSPLLLPENPAEEGKGVWIPNSFGDVTGLVLNVDKVGTDQMLQVRFGEDEELTPFTGSAFQIHLDELVEDRERLSKERTVILIDETPLHIDGSREIITYKIYYNEDRWDSSGVRMDSERTHYSLTFSRIKNDYEVLYLIPFAATFPNPNHPQARPAKPAMPEAGVPLRDE
ncbi:MAG: hypothetical protein JJT75_12400 [Opitutales bacterium]|nr:hypothetical protein [Opitutales bacterium]MCH8541871.1 hypothetical protein [Opitutales bacterium]